MSTIHFNKDARRWEFREPDSKERIKNFRRETALTVLRTCKREYPECAGCDYYEAGCQIGEPVKWGLNKEP